jgi:hypothetical protein
MIRKLYVILAFFFLIANVSVYCQNTKSRTQPIKSSKSSSTQSKPKVVKATNNPKTYRTNRQWKTNSSFGMFSSFPTKTKKSSSQKFDHFTENNLDESAGTENEKEAGLEKKEKQSFWKRLKLFKKE